MKNLALIKLFLFLFFICLLPTISKAQGGQLLLLKDRGVVVRSFTHGDFINFKFSNAQWITGYINWIKNDSIEVNQFALQGAMTQLGTYNQDTLKLGKLVLHINEIKSFEIGRAHV